MPLMQTHCTIYSPLLRHQRHLCGCRWWWCDLYGLWVLWDEGGLWVCLVQELPGHHRHLSSEYCQWRGQVSILYVPNFSCNFQGPTDYLALVLVQSLSPLQHFLKLSSHLVVPLSPGPELSSTVSPWRIWAPSPVWSPTLTTSPPATHSLRRVRQPTVLASLLLCAWNLIHLLFFWGYVSAKGVRSVYTPVCYPVSTAASNWPLLHSGVYVCLSGTLSQMIQCCMSVKVVVTFKVVLDIINNVLF